MRILITGVNGFAGRHLARHLHDSNPQAELFGVIISPDEPNLAPFVQHYPVDLRSETAVNELLETVRPDQIYHLAGFALVKQSFDVPWETIENNVRAQLNLIRACMRLETPPRMVMVTSGEIYGLRDLDEPPAAEDSDLRPTNPYSVSKVAQDMLGLQYYLSHKLPLLRARPFNHFGPGQNPGFVAPDFAMQIARIEAGLQPPVMKVGDLTARRDFTDVRDVVRAYALIMAHGEPGEAYNIGSSQTYSIQYLLDLMLQATTAEITVRSETGLLRPATASKTSGDSSKLRAVSGWEPQIPFEQTVSDVLNDWRQRVAAPSNAQ